MIIHAGYSAQAEAPALQERGLMVQKFGLTDLCLFTDARYTRHPAVTDMHSAFNEMPMAFDHFPSGSIIAPPERLKGHEQN